MQLPAVDAQGPAFIVYVGKCCVQCWGKEKSELKHMSHFNTHLNNTKF